MNKNKNRSFDWDGKNNNIMDIRPDKVKDEENFMKEIMKWRQQSHEYEEPKPFKNAEGKMIQNVFCNKCGQSAEWFIHNPPFGENVGSD